MLTERQLASLCTEFGRRVRVARKKKGLTHAQLSVMVGLSRTSVSNIEAGRQRVPIHVLWHLADALGVPVRDLVPDAPTTSSTGNKRVAAVLEQEPLMKSVSPGSRQRIRAFVASALDGTSTADETESD